MQIMCDFDHTCGEKGTPYALPIACRGRTPDASPLRRDRACILLRGAVRVVVMLPSLIAPIDHLFE
jgi:hypothetical protein